CRSGGTGRRAWFRSTFSQGSGGSSPFCGTIVKRLRFAPPPLVRQRLAGAPTPRAGAGSKTLRFAPPPLVRQRLAGAPTPRAGAGSKALRSAGRPAPRAPRWRWLESTALRSAGRGTPAPCGGGFIKRLRFAPPLLVRQRLAGTPTPRGFI